MKQFCYSRYSQLKLDCERKRFDLIMRNSVVTLANPSRELLNNIFWKSRRLRTIINNNHSRVYEPRSEIVNFPFRTLSTPFSCSSSSCNKNIVFDFPPINLINSEILFSQKALLRVNHRKIAQFPTENFNQNSQFSVSRSHRSGIIYSFQSISEGAFCRANIRAWSQIEISSKQCNVWAPMEITKSFENALIWERNKTWAEKPSQSLF